MKSAFFTAVAYGDLEYVRTVHKFRFMQVDIRSTRMQARIISGFSAIHYAIYFRQIAMFQYLIDSKSAFLELRTYRSLMITQGQTQFKINSGAGPLAIAVLSSPAIMRYLVDIYQIRRIAPIIASGRQNCYHVAAAIVSESSRIIAENEFLCYNLVDLQDDEGNNCLMNAVRAKNSAFLRSIVQQCENETIFNKVKLAVEQKNSKGQDVFSLAKNAPSYELDIQLSKLRHLLSIISDELTVENSDDVEIKMRMRKTSVKPVFWDEDYQGIDAVIF